MLLLCACFDERFERWLLLWRVSRSEEEMEEERRREKRPPDFLWDVCVGESREWRPVEWWVVCWGGRVAGTVLSLWPKRGIVIRRGGIDVR